MAVGRRIAAIFLVPVGKLGLEASPRVYDCIGESLELAIWMGGQDMAALLTSGVIGE